MDKVQQQLKNSIIILSGKALHILVCGAFFFTKEAAYPVTGKN